MKRLGMGICLLLLAVTGCDAAEPDDEARVLEDEAQIEELEAALDDAQPDDLQSLPPERTDELESHEDDSAVDPGIDEVTAEIDPDGMRWDCGGEPRVCCRDCDWDICCCVYIDGKCV